MFYITMILKFIKYPHFTVLVPLTIINMDVAVTTLSWKVDSIYTNRYMTTDSPFPVVRREPFMQQYQGNPSTECLQRSTSRQGVPFM